MSGGRKTVVPGVRVALDDVGRPLLDKRRRPIFKMPDPVRAVKHFLSAGRRAEYEVGKISFDAATQVVPIYRGYDVRVARALKNDAERRRVKRWYSGRRE